MSTQLATQATNNVVAMNQSMTPNNPDYLIQLAIEKGADMDKIDKLLDLRDRWAKTEAKKEYDKAFSDFKASAIKIIKNKSVTGGPLSGRKYAELSNIVNTITPELSRYGLSHSWKITKDDRDWIEVTCILRHQGGHEETVSLGGAPDAGGAKNSIQSRASTVSYLQRYTLKAITGIAEQDDDTDGETTKEKSSNETLLIEAKSLDELNKAMQSISAKEKGKVASLYNQRQQELRQ